MASKVDERTLKREGVCAGQPAHDDGASSAGLLVQNTLKYLLQFGSVTPFLGYNALGRLLSHLPHATQSGLRGTAFCRRRQQEVTLRKAAEAASAEVDVEKVPDVPIITHEDNEWGISVLDESETRQDTVGTGCSRTQVRI